VPPRKKNSFVLFLLTSHELETGKFETENHHASTV
jgi:hypothetical protein